MGMHSIYKQQLVQPVAAPLAMHTCGYTGGVVTVRVLPYPAIYVNVQVHVANLRTSTLWTL